MFHIVLVTVAFYIKTQSSIVLRKYIYSITALMISAENTFSNRTGVVAQLAERLLPIPEVRKLNAVIGKVL